MFVYLTNLSCVEKGRLQEREGQVGFDDARVSCDLSQFNHHTLTYIHPSHLTHDCFENGRVSKTCRIQTSKQKVRTVEKLFKCSSEYIQIACMV